MQLQFTDVQRLSNQEFFKAKLKNLKRNFNNNLPLILKHGSIPILNLKDVLIIGAGPSLDLDLPLIRKHRKEFTVVSADMALKPLLKNNIKPDIVISVETHKTDFFNGLDTEGVNLMAYVCINPLHIRAFKGRVAFYNIDGDPSEIQAPGVAVLKSGGNVATTAMTYARGCGAERIIISGVDHDYKHHCYCRDTVRDDDFMQDRFTPVETFQKNLAQSGDMDAPFFIARKWVEDFQKYKTLFKMGENNNGSNYDRGQAVPG